MKWITSIILLLSLLFSQDKRSVEIYSVEKEGYMELYARNNNIYPVTYELQLELTNLKADRKLTPIAFLKPSSNQKILELTQIDPAEKWDYRTSYKFYMGSILAIHDKGIAYQLPYPKGMTYKLDQGFGGKFSHQGDLQHALDFNMPDGSDVYAARGGKVVMVKEDSDRGGPSEDMMEQANYITILHSDGTFADYTHLKFQGAIVEPGQEVRTGQLIGYAGSTGYATGPHLHFVVKKAKRGGGFTSIPIKFVTKNGISELVEGQEYMSY